MSRHTNGLNSNNLVSKKMQNEFHSRLKLNFWPLAGVGIQLKYCVRNLNTRREMNIFTLNDICQAEVYQGSVEV